MINPAIPAGFLMIVFIASSIPNSGFSSSSIKFAKNLKLLTDLVASTFLAKVIGFPVSLDSSFATSSNLFSSSLAIFFNQLARSLIVRFDHRGNAFFAALTAKSISLKSDLGIVAIKSPVAGFKLFIQLLLIEFLKVPLI